VKRFNFIKTAAAFAGVIFALMVITTVAEPFQYGDEEECALIVGGEKLRFVARPDLGYVVKARPDSASLEALPIMGIRAIERSPICGLGRRGFWVVHSERSADENGRTIKLLRSRSGITYIAPLFSSGGDTVVIIPEIVVRLKPDTQMDDLQKFCELVDGTIIKPMEFTTQEYLLEVLGPDAEAVFTAVEQLNEIDSVEWACPNTAFQPKLRGQPVLDDVHQGEYLSFGEIGEDANAPGVFPNDEYFPMQWHLHNTGQSGGTPGADIRAPEAWDITTGDPDIIVSVQDTGVVLNHPDLVDNLVPGYDFLDGDELPGPSLEYFGNAHGTSCAGLIAARGNNGIGVTGVTWNCKILPVRDSSTRANGTGYWCTEADDATAMRWEASHGVDVMSNSWYWGTAPVPIIHSAIVDVTKAGGLGRGGKGCVVVFGAGNDSRPINIYPQKYAEVIRVGATDHNDRLCWYSNYGPDLDLTAPGGSSTAFPSLQECMRLATDLLWTTDIPGLVGFSTMNENVASPDYTDKMFGTSASCPIMAGVAALILSVEPNLTNEEVRHYLCRSAKDLGDPGRDDHYGWGRVDARAALDMVLTCRADLNKDGIVDQQDLSILEQFMGTSEPLADIAPAARPDGVVDELDRELMIQYWQKEYPQFGLLAYWRLDETEGETAHSSATTQEGMVYGATLQGDPLWQPDSGMLGGALLLDGIDDCVETPFIVDPSAGPFSVFAWIKGGEPGQVLVSQQAVANWLSTDNEGKLMTELKCTGRSAGYLFSETVIIDGQWHRIGLVWDGSHRMLFVDDVMVAEDTQHGLEGFQMGLYIGTGKNMETGTYFSGLIDDVRIYNRAIEP
jgi:subtilisin family serine protease